MKQTVEEAAKEYCKKNFQYLEHLYLTISTAFETGSYWQSKQSLWISVEDAIPNKQAKGVCQVKYVDGSIDEMAMREVNKWVYPYINTGYITHWRPSSN